MSVDDLRNNAMMAHLLDSLEAGKDIGHYGRLVFAMVGRHFLSEAELVDYLQRDPDFPILPHPEATHESQGGRGRSTPSKSRA
jgi:hypothetical protein